MQNVCQIATPERVLLKQCGMRAFMPYGFSAAWWRMPRTPRGYMAFLSGTASPTSQRIGGASNSAVLVIFLVFQSLRGMPRRCGAGKKRLMRNCSATSRRSGITSGVARLSRENGVMPLVATSVPVRRVAVVGGTHGNEANGVSMVQHFQRNPREVQRESFFTEVLIANTAAVEKNFRYLDKDLNRCFGLVDLNASDGDATCVEMRRARELNAILGPKGSREPCCDFVIDLHNTTSNCGVSLMMAPCDSLAHEVAYHLSTQVDPEIRIVEWPEAHEWPMLPTCGRSGFTVEAGAVPQGCLNGDLYKRVRCIVHAALDCLEARNRALTRGHRCNHDLFMPVFQRVGVIRYPLAEDGKILGMVHPDLQDNDFVELEEGSPLFLMLDGSTRFFSRKEHNVAGRSEKIALHALFVNEAAYYKETIALAVALRAERQVEAAALLQ